MAKLLLGKDVAAAMNEESRTRAAALAEQGAGPKLAIIRCGGGEDDISYEKSAQRAAETAGAGMLRPTLIGAAAGTV